MFLFLLACVQPRIPIEAVLMLISIGMDKKIIGFRKRQ